MTNRITTLIKGLAIEILGWLLVAIGLLALVLPGPGLLALFAGIALLATRYEWANRRLKPIRTAALKATRDSVSSQGRILISGLFVISLAAIGIMWGLHPQAPEWWPISDTWWLPGGWSVGASLILSSVVAGASIGYAFLRYRD